MRNSLCISVKSFVLFFSVFFTQLAAAHKLNQEHWLPGQGFERITATSIYRSSGKAVVLSGTNMHQLFLTDAKNGDVLGEGSFAPNGLEKNIKSVFVTGNEENYFGVAATAHEIYRLKFEQNAGKITISVDSLVMQGVTSVVSLTCDASPTGRVVAIGLRDHSTGWLKEYRDGHIHVLTIPSDASSLVLAVDKIIIGFDKEIRVLDIDDLSIKDSRRIKISTFANRITALALSKDQKTILFGTKGGEVGIVEREGGKSQIYDLKQLEPISAIAFGNDIEQVFLTSAHSHLQKWQIDLEDYFRGCFYYAKYLHEAKEKDSALALINLIRSDSNPYVQQHIAPKLIDFVPSYRNLRLYYIIVQALRHYDVPDRGLLRGPEDCEPAYPWPNGYYTDNGSLPCPRCVKYCDSNACIDALDLGALGTFTLTALPLAAVFALGFYVMPFDICAAHCHLHPWLKTTFRVLGVGAGALVATALTSTTCSQCALNSPCRCIGGKISCINHKSLDGESYFCWDCPCSNRAPRERLEIAEREVIKVLKAMDTGEQKERFPNERLFLDYLRVKINDTLREMNLEEARTLGAPLLPDMNRL